MSVGTTIIAITFQQLSRIANDIIDDTRIRRIKDTINAYAIISAIAGGATAILPGAAAVGAIAVQAGFIWSLYVKISKELGISIKDNKLKFIASAALSNITTNAGMLIVGHATATFFSFIPGLGSAASLFLEAMIGYVVIYVAAIIYLQFVIRLFKANKGKRDFSSISDEELKKAMDRASAEVNMKDAINEGKQAYNEARKNGDFERVKNNPRCPNCNSLIEKNAKFCSICGLKIR